MDRDDQQIESEFTACQVRICSSIVRPELLDRFPGLNLPEAVRPMVCLDSLFTLGSELKLKLPADGSEGALRPLHVVHVATLSTGNSNQKI